jgi:hypothetical protein
MSKYGGFAFKLCCYDQCILSQYSKPQVAKDQKDAKGSIEDQPMMMATIFSFS